MIDLTKNIVGIQYERDLTPLNIDAELEPLLLKVNEAIENFLFKGFEE